MSAATPRPAHASASVGAPAPADAGHAAHDHHDPEGARIGMWLFLVTEMLLFGGLLLLYSVYRARYAEEFASAGAALSAPLGLLNTVILLTSSFTMACSITALRRGAKGACLALLAATLLLAGGFLAVKTVEWGGKFSAGLHPGGAALAGASHGKQMFYGLYYSMTGLHGLHVLAGMVALAASLALVAAGSVTGSDATLLENVGLYWHLVDVIWIFLLPLFYLAV